VTPNYTEEVGIRLAAASFLKISEASPKTRTIVHNLCKQLFLSVGCIPQMENVGR
jgi:hypothetical protein